MNLMDPVVILAAIALIVLGLVWLIAPVVLIVRAGQLVKEAKAANAKLDLLHYHAVKQERQHAEENR